MALQCALDDSETLRDAPNSISTTDRPCLSSMEVPVSSIRLHSRFYINGGAYSDIWKATLKRDGVDVPVAVKVLRRNGKTQVVLGKNLIHEVACWGTLDHKNISPLYGICFKCVDGRPAMVLPWYGNGTANEYLERHPDVDPIHIIKEIAAGLAYMHDMGIVHGDIKGANVMIDDHGNPRLIDFGLSHSIDMHVDGDLDVNPSGGFSVRWCAPELLKPGAMSTPSSDVYAFASMVLELLSRHVPYHNVPERIVFGQVMKGVPPSIQCSDLSRLYGRYGQHEQEEVLALLRSCWEKAALRPNMSEVRERLVEFSS